MSAVIAALGAAVAAAFAASTWARYRRRRANHHLFWTLALGMFSAASAFLAYGLGLGWGSFVFGGYYLFGAILNVPFLGLGQVWLLWPGRWAYAASVVVVAFAIASVLTVVTAPMTVPPSGSGHIPSGREVYASEIPEDRLPDECRQEAAERLPICDRQADPLAVWPRILAAIGNIVGTVLVLVGTIGSALRLLRRHNRTSRGRRLAIANLLIAGGVIIVASGGTGARFGATVVLPFTLAAGVTVMYAGFVVATSPPESDPALPTSGSEPGVRESAGEIAP